MPGYDDEEIEVEFIEDQRETDIYGNAITPPEWSGADDVDGEELIEFLLNGGEDDDDA